MPISNSDQLFKLVKSLTKAEKRNFTLYCKRLQKEGDTAKFVDLFSVLDKQNDYDEEQARHKIGRANKSQFANLRRHLYQHLLTSLRLMHMNKEAEIQIREQIDYAFILYGKGFYLEALKILDRAKRLARANNLDLLHLETVEFEKKIESRHITRSTTERMIELIEESDGRNRILSNIIRLSNLKLNLQRHFINHGSARNDREQERIALKYRALLPREDDPSMSFFEKIFLYECFYWYHYITLDFVSCHYYTRKWVALYEVHPNMIEEDVDMYLRGIHHLLNSSWFTQDAEIFDETLAVLKFFTEGQLDQLNSNSQTLALLYRTQWEINQHFLQGSFRKGLPLVPRTLATIQLLEDKLDRHKIFILYYKIAGLYLGAGQPDQAIDFLNKIVNAQSGHLREDIQCYSRLMLLMAHFEWKNFELMDSLLRSTGRFISRMKDRSRMQEVLLLLFRELLKNPYAPPPGIWKDYATRFESLSKLPAERRSFLYVDALAWVRKMDISPKDANSTPFNG